MNRSTFSLLPLSMPRPMLALAVLATTAALVLPARAAVPVAATAAEGSVGQVSLVVGKAEAIAANGQRRVLERGSAVRIGERIETQAGGHVHIAFVDGGRVSVRPASRLHIEDYSRPVANSAGGAIRFRLEEGVVRSITGQWGEESKERFRLNTPLAAIGVKGTDFAVRSDGEKTAASVYTGAIVVAPLDAACATTVGVCANGQERLLTAGMKGQMLELGKSQTAPQFVPAVDLLAQSTRTALPEMRTASLRSPAGADRPADRAADRPDAAATAAADRPFVGEALAAGVADLAARPPEVNHLRWGRIGAALPGDELSQPLGTALASGNPRVTIGNFTHTLLTTAAPMAAGAVIGGGEAVGNFRLADSAATLFGTDGNALEAATVSAGTLSIDFARLLFSTQLRLSSPTLGTDLFSANGSVSSAGYFVNYGKDQLIAGALTPDGKEAGYLFEKKVNPGTVKGITLWGR